MERLSKYLIGGMALLTAYTANMGWRMSKVAEYSVVLGEARTQIHRANNRDLHNISTKSERELANEIKELTPLLEEDIKKEKRKAFFILDWPNLFSDN